MAANLNTQCSVDLRRINQSEAWVVRSGHQELQNPAMDPASWPCSDGTALAAKPPGSVRGSQPIAAAAQPALIHTDMT